MKTLAEVIAEHEFGDEDFYCRCGWKPHGDHWGLVHAEHVAAAWRAERTITTVEQLDAMPWHTLIENQGIPLKKLGKTSWYRVDTGYRHDDPLPARVLFVPGEEQ